jgi:hypothetical protein
MTTKTTITCAIAVALLAGTASFLVPAAAHSASLSRSHHTKSFLNAVAIYDAGLRRGTANSSRTAYLRGFRDGTSSEAYSGRGYLVDSYAGYPAAAAPTLAPAPAPVYSSYGRDAVYTPGTGGYYDGRSVSSGDGYGNSQYSVAYGDGYGTGYSNSQYNPGYAPRGLMDVAVAPLVLTPPMDARAAHLNYCAARYQSFDPASGTFLADDGYRYYCQ